MFLYKLKFIPTSFVIIGAGGTGGRLVPLLAQFLRTVAWIQNPRIFLIDHDVVEEKNLVRQNFIRPDINRPKAVVLAERYSKAFDVTIIPVVKKVGPDQAILSEVQHAEHGLIKTTLANLNNAFVVLCVDSADARRAILNNLLSSNRNQNLLFIDSGNENDFGQVQVFSPEYYGTHWGVEDIKLLNLPGIGLPFDVDLPILPFPKMFYETMEDGSARSCAELDQTLAINALMATSMMGIMQNLIYQKPIAYSKLNVSLQHGSIPELLTVNMLYARCLENLKSANKIVHPMHIQTLDDVFQKIYKRLEKEHPTLLYKDAVKEAAAKAEKEKARKAKKLSGDEAKSVLSALLEAERAVNGDL